MPVDLVRLRQSLQAFDFKSLFTQQLGWEHHKARLEVAVTGQTFFLEAVAEKRGMQVFQCVAPDSTNFPDSALRRQIDRQVTRSVREHILIYTDAGQTRQIWQWVRRKPGQPLACREFRFDKGQSGEAVAQRVQHLAFTLDEEEQITLVDVTGRAGAALDVDRVTKRFYELFKTEHSAFLKFIEGIPDDADCAWYASLMLNRLMFIYFIQKKSFLDGDPDYLHHRLEEVKKQKGNDKFHSFYRYFLVRLFHEGLGLPKSKRKPDLDTLLGKVPYLNGGLFDPHDLENAYPKIDIPDKAFERLFAFFDEYRWHLDDRPLANDKEINPDVLGYIFEKYINQKQMGAYYTKEDITGYIARNTIIPFLFDATHKQCAVPFDPASALWRLLSDDPDRYIYDAVRKGVDVPLPGEIAAGINDVAKRDGWNRPAGADFALPTETWREHIARRQRCEGLRGKLRAGEVHAINDLVTYNLDICQFAQDAIENCEGPELLRAFYRAIESVSILDPTCGSGAFLFAALNTLQPLYDACLDRMEAFIEDLERAAPKHSGDGFTDFREVLADVARHPNRRHFIFKSIIVKNLYGVDIMDEAVEICKLRLFLKLVAQLEPTETPEPLPDIDFNIRAGNTLVGFASAQEVRDTMKDEIPDFVGQEIAAIDASVKDADEAFQLFRKLQTQFGADALDYSERKQGLQADLKKLRDQLDRYLAGQYEGVDPEKPKVYAKWRESHKPFHWFAEFYGVMSHGGFDVIIGNPPYVASRKVTKQYTVHGYKTQDCPDIYSWCLERVCALANRLAYTGMIVPLSLGFSGDFDVLRKLLFNGYGANWFSSFGRIPSALFNYDVRVRNTIHLGSKQAQEACHYTSRLHRWFEDARAALFPSLQYVPFTPLVWKCRVPKINTVRLGRAMEDCLTKHASAIRDLLSTRTTPHELFFKKTAYNWLAFSRKPPPCFDSKGRSIPQSQLDSITVSDQSALAPLHLLLNGKLVYAFWCVLGDDFHVTKWNFAEFPIDQSHLAEIAEQLADLPKELERAMEKATSFKLNAGKKVGNYNLAMCRPVTDKSDRLFAKLIGLESAWEDVELYCAQVVRTGFEDETES